MKILDLTVQNNCLKIITFLENFIYLKDYVGDHLKDKEKEKAKEFLLKNKESSLGGIRQVSPQNFTEFAHTNVYKAYIGVKRKFKVQHAIIKY